MTKGRKITTGLIIVALIIIVVIRLISNKRSFENQLKMVSEVNTTIPVMTDTVRYIQVEQGFSINGTFSPGKEISVTSEVLGKIASVAVRAGDKVKKGQRLAAVEHEMSASQLELAKFNLEKAEKDLARFEKLSGGDAVTAQQYESVEQVYINAKFAYTSAKVQYENSFIKAPFDGSLTKSYIEEGSFVSPGAPLFDIVETDPMKFIAKLSSSEVEKVTKGEEVRLSVETYPSAVYRGCVSKIIVKADLARLYDVEIDVRNTSINTIKPGMYGVATFSQNAGEEALVIPRRAIAASILNPEVFLVKGDSVLKQAITTASLDDKYVVVRTGLKKGDIIVVSGQINLVDGSRIRINN